MRKFSLPTPQTFTIFPYTSPSKTCRFTEDIKSIMFIKIDEMHLVKEYVGEEYLNVATLSIDWKNVWGQDPKITRLSLNTITPEGLTYAFDTGLTPSYTIAKQCAILDQLDLLKIVVGRINDMESEEYEEYISLDNRTDTAYYERQVALLERFEYFSELIYIAISNGNMEMVKWIWPILVERGCYYEIGMDVHAFAAGCGDVEFMKDIEDYEVCPPSDSIDNAYNFGLESENFEAFKHVCVRMDERHDTHYSTWERIWELVQSRKNMGLIEWAISEDFPERPLVLGKRERED